jgi:hypothetical protein
MLGDKIPDNPDELKVLQVYKLYTNQMTVHEYVALETYNRKIRKHGV